MQRHALPPSSPVILNDVVYVNLVIGRITSGPLSGELAEFAFSADRDGKVTAWLVCPAFHSCRS